MTFSRCRLPYVLIVLATAPVARGAVPCTGGTAGPYPCSGMDLLSQLSLDQIGGGEANDCWGWQDPVTGEEYAIVGLTNGTSFVNVTDPENPVHVAFLPSHTGTSAWRDIKTYADHAFVVSDGNGAHGLQVFDLTELRAVVSPPATVAETSHFAGFAAAHNLVINEDTGFLYVVGSNQASGGLYILNVQNPAAPVFAGIFSADGYTHDAQCVIYTGPDVSYVGREICACCNEDTVTLVDVTNKSSTVQLSRTSYPGAEYVNQGWLTEDHRYLLTTDELDEAFNGTNTRTHLWDVSDLDLPTYVGFHEASTAAIDHNQYVKGSLLYQANYRAGLRVLDLEDITNGNLTEVGFFDIYPADDAVGFDGAWSTYPYLPSGNILVSGIEQGLFVLAGPDLSTAAPAPARADVAALRVSPNPFRPGTTVTYTLARPGPVRVLVYDVAGRRVATLEDGPRSAGSHSVAWLGQDEEGRDAGAGIYFVRLEAGSFSETRRITRLR